MSHVDEEIVESFRDANTAVLAEAIEFSTALEQDPDEQRQVAQEAVAELATSWVKAMQDAYTKIRGDVDHGAITAIFDRVAVYAKLDALSTDPYSITPVKLDTRREKVQGDFIKRDVHDGVDSVNVVTGSTTDDDRWIPVVSIHTIEVL